MLDSTDKIYDSLHAPGPGWDRVLEGFQSINSTAGKSDIPVFVVLFPLLDQLSDYSYVQIHEKVREAAEEQGFIVVDLLPTFQKASTESTMPLWLDELHPTPTGYRIAAETLLAALEDTRVLPARHYSAKSGVDK